jgi:hypothetical protein
MQAIRMTPDLTLSRSLAETSRIRQRLKEVYSGHAEAFNADGYFMRLQ